MRFACLCDLVSLAVLLSMPHCLVCQVGGIRRIVVPVELGYPGNNYRKQGPKPTTFSVSNHDSWHKHTCIV